MKNYRFERLVWRNNRKKCSLTLHPDIYYTLKDIAAEEGIPLSVVADETFYAGLKALGSLE